MIGQTELMKQFNSYTLQTLPQSLMIEGEFGCGKHLLVAEIADRLGVVVEDITTRLNYEYLSLLTIKALPTFYIVEGDQLSQRDQNALLKFLEEPAVEAHIFVLCETRHSLLETIQSRCSIFKFAPYTQQELESLTENKLILDYAKTPGQIKEFEKIDLDALISLCYTILHQIDSASIPNILTLSKKFNFGKEEGKFSIDLFCRLLLNQTFKEVVKEDRFASAYRVVGELVNKLRVPNIDKKKLFESKLLDLKFALK